MEALCLGTKKEEEEEEEGIIDAYFCSKDLVEVISLRKAFDLSLDLFEQ